MLLIVSFSFLPDELDIDIINNIDLPCCGSVVVRNCGMIVASMQIYLVGLSTDKTFAPIRAVLENLDFEYFVREDGKLTFFDDFKDSQNRINSADAVIVDASILETEAQWELAYALDSSKPTLLLVARDASIVDRLLSVQHKHVTIKTYADPDELRREVTSFIDQVKNSLDAKLFMIIPPSVNRYLEWVVTNTSKSKSDVVRSAVDGVAEKDKDYQSFLKGLKSSRS